MFQKIRYRLVYNRKGRLNAQGKALVQMELLLHRRRTYFSTNVYLKPDEWDGGRVVGHPLAAQLNAYLMEGVIEAERVEMGFICRGVAPTLAMMREAVEGHMHASAAVADFIASVNSHATTRGASTRAAYGQLAKVVERFQKGATLQDITLDWLCRFTEWQRTQGVAQSTVACRLKGLRAIVNEAVARRLIRTDDDPFHHFKIPRIAGREGFLTIDELRAMRRLDLTGREAHIRDAALFTAVTGLRFSDLNTLASGNIVVEEGRTWLVKRPEKTKGTSGVEVRLPIYALFGGVAASLIEGYGGVEGLAHVGNNAAANRTLKAIVARLGIAPERRITWHSLRHSFVTNLLALGVPITTVQRMAGHTKVAMTAAYAHVGGDIVRSDVERAFPTPPQTEGCHGGSTP